MTKPVDHASDSASSHYNAPRQRIGDGDIPNLPHGCGSWIVTRNDSGATVCEVFRKNRHKLKWFWRDMVTIRTAADHLASLDTP